MLNRLFPVALCALALPLSAGAQTTTIDFDAFTDGQNLHGVNLGGVTLTGPNGVIEVHTDDVAVAYRSPFNAVTVLREDGGDFLTGTFDESVFALTLFGGDGGGDIDSFTLRIYDAAVGGTLLDSVTTTPYDGDPYQGLTLMSDTGIRRFEAEINTPFGVAFDDLSFTIPEPALAGLLPAALLLLRRLNRSARRVG